MLPIFATAADILDPLDDSADDGFRAPMNVRNLELAQTEGVVVFRGEERDLFGDSDAAQGEKLLGGDERRDLVEDHRCRRSQLEKRVKTCVET